MSIWPVKPAPETDDVAEEYENPPLVAQQQ
jgi:hypothetical protein